MAKRNKEALLMALAQALRAFVLARQHSSDMAERRRFMSRNDDRDRERDELRRRDTESRIEARKPKPKTQEEALNRALRVVPSKHKAAVALYLTGNKGLMDEWKSVPPPSDADVMSADGANAVKKYQDAQARIEAALAAEELFGMISPDVATPSTAKPTTPFTDEDYVKTLEQSPTKTVMGSKLIDGMVGGPGAGMREKLNSFGPQPRSTETGSDEWVQNLTNTMNSNEPSDVAERQRTIAQSMPQANGTPLDQRLAGEFAYYQSLVFNPNTPLQEQAIAYAKLANYGIEPPADIKEMLWGSGQSLASLREGVRDPSMLGFGTVGLPQIQAAMQNPVGVAPQPPYMNAYARVRKRELDDEVGKRR